jgi:hypothetical protein
VTRNYLAKVQSIAILNKLGVRADKKPPNQLGVNADLSLAEN